VRPCRSPGEFPSDVCYRRSRATREARTQRSRTGEEQAGIPERGQPRPRAAPLTRRTRERPAQDLAHPPQAPLPLARRPAREGHSPIADPRGKRRMKKVQCLTTRQASLHATDRSVASPKRAFDAGLRPGPFPGQNASLLPGSLAIIRTGLAPAGDDKLPIRS
jgi:hypothetical protein